MKNIHRITSILILTFFFFVVGSPTQAAAETERDEIATIIQEHVKKAKIPSVSAGMIHGDEVSFLSQGNQPSDRSLIYKLM